ncbi:MAG: hypothetical protein ACOYYS_27200 [Chloroflexota bacterium]
MHKITLHKAFGLDPQVGRVDEDGKVYERVAGQGKHDRYVGRIDLSNGKVYDAASTPERYMGRVDKDGRVYQAQLGPDEYLGKVGSDGRLYHHKRLARDAYLGHVEGIEGMENAHLGGAAFLLLVYPAWQASQQNENEKA